MVRIEYSPACSHFSHLNWNHNNATSGWWRETDLFKHNSLLISAYYGMNYKNFRKDLNIPENVLLIGDSGGFQNATLSKVKINPVEVLKWQEQNCDIGFILDVPPYDFSGSRSLSGNASELFDESLKETKQNVERVLPYRNKESKMKWYGVIQGQTYKQQEKWFNELKDYMFDGWALSPKPASNPWIVASYLLFAYEKGIKNIHILQVSGIKCMQVIYYISKYFPKDSIITFDSSSFIKWGSELRKFQLAPFSNNFISVTKNNISNLHCDCPICKNVDFQMFKEKGGKNGFFLSLHNLYMKLKENKILNELINNSEEEFKKMCSNEILECFEYIDYSIQNGIKNGNEKYTRKFKISDSKQKTIWD